MNFDLSDEQRMLGDAVTAFLGKAYRFEDRRARDDGVGDPRAMWRQLCELGVVSLPFDADCGGIGGGPVESMIVQEAFGAALVLQPYLSCSVMAGNALQRLAWPGLKSSLLPRIASGETIVAWSHDDAADSLRAVRTSQGWLLHGERRVVLGAGLADQVLVTAAIEGGDGWAIFLVGMGQQGLARSAYRMPDQHDAADLLFDGVAVPLDHLIGEPGAVLADIAWVQDLGIAAVCAEAVGAMAECLRATVQHLSVRQQFGVALSTMQALRHRVADMQVELELSRSMMMYAAACCGDEDAPRRAMAMSAAKVRIGRAGRHIGQEAVQLHGGMGMTEECKAGHLLRRLVVIDMLFEDSDEHLRRLADAGGLIEAAAW